MKQTQGFTLIELLIVVAIIGIIAAIAIPNLLNAIQNAKQKATMGDMKSLAGAAELYSVDHSRYPVQTTCDTAENIAKHLNSYLRGQGGAEIDIQDAWGNPLYYYTDGIGETYTICSGGKDGSNCCSPDNAGGPISNFDLDIMFSTGSFVSWPEGAQQ